MGRELTAKEREQVEGMRDQIAERMQHLDDEESYGNISSYEKDQQLQAEFGDYSEALRELNQLLHAKTVQPALMHHFGLAAMVLVGVSILTLVGLFAGPTVTGFSFISDTTMELDMTLENERPVTPPLQGNLQITKLSAIHHGEGKYILYIHDRHKKHVLLTGDESTNRCPGCGEKLEPPYLLEYEGSGQIQVLSMTVGENVRSNE